MMVRMKTMMMLMFVFSFPVPDSEMFAVRGHTDILRTVSQIVTLPSSGICLLP